MFEKVRMSEVSYVGRRYFGLETGLCVCFAVPDSWRIYDHLSHWSGRVEELIASASSWKGTIDYSEKERRKAKYRWRNRVVFSLLLPNMRLSLVVIYNHRTDLGTYHLSPCAKTKKRKDGASNLGALVPTAHRLTKDHKLSRFACDINLTISQPTKLLP
jgi:hypothetical protein